MTWQEISFEDRAAQVGFQVFGTDELKAVDERLDLAIRSFDTRPEGHFAAFVGEPGVGKTIAAEAFMNAFAKRWGGVYDDVKMPERPLAVAAASYVRKGEKPHLTTPIVRLKLMPGPSFRSLMEETVLAITGAKLPARWNTSNIMTLLHNQLVGQGIRLIIFDDAQHVAETKAAGGAYHAAEVFKMLAKVTGAEIALFGVPSLLGLFAINGQLARLKEQRHTIRPLPYPRDLNSPFMRFLASMNNILPFDAKCDVANIIVGSRIHEFTEGKPALVSLLLQQATKYAVLKNINVVNQDVLALTIRYFFETSDEENIFKNFSPPTLPEVDADLAAVGATADSNWQLEL